MNTPRVLSFEIERHTNIRLLFGYPRELMNINQGFLDVLGVNTFELSRMVYRARECGAIGSKITGAGGGGSIIALCPNNIDQVAEGISKEDNVLKIRFTRKGVSSRVRD